MFLQAKIMNTSEGKKFPGIQAIRFSEYLKQFLELYSKINKVGVLAKFVFSQALLYLSN